MAFGLHNLTNQTTNASNAAGANISTVNQQIYDTAAQNVAGTAPILGLFFLAVVGYIMHSSNMTADSMAVVMTPLIFLLGVRGYLPFGQGIIYGFVLSVAALVAFALYKFGFR